MKKGVGMLHQRSLQIENRLEQVPRLIRTGKYSTPKLADEVGLSIPTISRCVLALRERGQDIRAERHLGGWRYVLHRPTSRQAARRGARAAEAAP